MPNRIELENRARVVGIDPATYVNDSQLEQRIIYNEKNQATAAGTQSTVTLTSDATNNSDGETVTLGTTIYTWKTALTEVKASQTLTSNNTNVSNNDQVVIGPITYTFKTTIAKPYDVNIGASADASLTNLVSAITGAGTIGTDYGTGTVTNTQVTAGAVGSHATTITALNPGTYANGITLYTGAATLTFGGATLLGGVEPVANQVLIGGTASISLDNLKSAVNATAGAGTAYSTGTKVHPLVVAGTKTATTLVFTAKVPASGFSIASTETGAHTSFGSATLSGNVQAIIAAPTYSSIGQTGGALV